MGIFDWQQKVRLARSLITRNAPVYVQYYITSRCNMSCEQCNVIYSYADVVEANLEQVEAIADNLYKIGVCMVLLIGGEPFVRKDLPEIIRIFCKRGIHVRMQTNGLASRERLADCVKAGGKDISISLDTLEPDKQDKINGKYPKSFHRALHAVSNISDLLDGKGTGFFGTVMMPSNLDDIPDVIRFATAIGWGVSLVPAHVTTPDRPRGFCTYDQNMRFTPDLYPKVAATLDICRQLRREGYNLYDSDEYLKDIYHYITNQPVQWRRRNNNQCDSPNLYFAIEPDGCIAPCCDYRLDKTFPVYDPDFPRWYLDRRIHAETKKFTENCEGCMYGSYPEMTITARYFRPFWERFNLFNQTSAGMKKLSPEELIKLAEEIRSGGRSR